MEQTQKAPKLPGIVACRAAVGFGKLRRQGSADVEAEDGSGRTGSTADDRADHQVASEGQL
jgi:hypothetical protein